MSRVAATPKIVILDVPNAVMARFVRAIQLAATWITRAYRVVTAAGVSCP